MRVIKTEKFEKVLATLPKETQELVKEQEARFLQNPLDPRLHIKQKHGPDKAYSLRVTRNYRILFFRQDRDTAVWFKISHRKDVYR